MSVYGATRVVFRFLLYGLYRMKVQGREILLQQLTALAEAGIEEAAVVGIAPFAQRCDNINNANAAMD